MTTTPKPISDEDLAACKSALEARKGFHIGHEQVHSLIARIEAQQASLASKDAEIERLRGAMERAENDLSLGYRENGLDWLRAALKQEVS